MKKLIEHIVSLVKKRFTGKMIINFHNGKIMKVTKEEIVKI